LGNSNTAKTAPASDTEAATRQAVWKPLKNASLAELRRIAASSACPPAARRSATPNAAPTELCAASATGPLSRPPNRLDSSLA
jgi:hypothetical protein